MKKYLLALALVIISITNAQLTLVKQLANNEVPDYEDVEVPQIFNNKMYYIGNPANAQDCKIYVTDGTAAGTILVKDLGSIYTTGNGNYSVTGSFNQTEDRLYFIRSQHLNPSTGGLPTEMTTELWVTDGTTAGTIKLLSKVTPVVNYSAVSPMSLFGRGRVKEMNDNFIGNKLLFTAYDPDNSTVGNSNQIAWVSDGTIAGTHPLLTSNGEKIYGGATGGTKLNNEYFFGGRAQASISPGGFMYKTNGTSAGTVKVNGNVDGWFVGSHFSKPLNGMFLFWASHQPGGAEANYEIWKSDGTAAGTQLFLETASGSASKKPYYGNILDFVNDGEKFYFNLKQDPAVNNMNEVWITDLTLNNTKKIRDATDYLVDDILVSDGHIFFEEFIQSPATYRLSYSDGSNIGTYVVSTKNINRNSLALYQGSAYYKDFDQMVPYFTQTVQDNKEVWRSDGTVGNTVRLLDVLPGTTTVSSYTISKSSEPKNFFTLGDSVYFITESPKNLYKFKGDYTFNGVVDNTWSNVSNWNAGALPGFTDPVIIPTGANVNVDVSAYAGNLNLDSPLNLTTGNLTIGGNLDLGAKITLNSNSLILGPSAQVSNHGPSQYIVTNGTGSVAVQNVDPSRGVVTIPIGTLTNYNPVQLQNNGTADEFYARVSEGVSNTTNASVNATWYISESAMGGSDATISLQWNGTQEQNGFSRTQGKVGHEVNGTWIQENSSTVSGTDSYQISASGIMAFSPFTVMNFGSLGTHDIVKKNMQIYPNPFADYIIIESEEIGSFRLFDGSGRLIMVEKLVAGKQKITTLPKMSGTYYYQIQYNQDKMHKGKLIKK